MPIVGHRRSYAKHSLCPDPLPGRGLEDRLLCASYYVFAQHKSRSNWKLIFRVAPVQTLSSTSEFRTETLFVCPFIPWHGWLFVRQMYATCKSFPNLSAPPPSTHSVHTLTPQQML